VSDGLNATHFVHVGDNPVLELDPQGAVLVRRLYGNRLDEVYAEERAGTTRWLLTDQVGSVRDVIAGNGTVVAHYAYDSYGRRLIASGDAGAATLGFQARPLDPATGLMHFRAREYDPLAGRFISRDPREPYRYNFALQNPLQYSDPTGESVLVEYACLASNAAFVAYSFGKNVAYPVGILYLNIASALKNLTPPPGDGGIKALGEGIAAFGGYPPVPTSFDNAVDILGITPIRFIHALACAEGGTAGASARAQGRAAGGGPSGFSWTGPSWTK
jgi:RHS repeat-associated protein